MKCPKCKAEVPDNSKFCLECGTRVRSTTQLGGTGTPPPGSVTGAETICPEFGIDFFLAGRYQIKKEIGRGGMGVVYLAYDDVLDIDIALKVLPTLFAANPRAIEALKSEARTAMKLRHPGIVGLHNFVESPDANFLVMEYVEGKSLDEILHDKSKLTLEETLETAKPIAEALDYAHSQSVLHRDIKPGNILIGNGQQATGGGDSHHLRAGPDKIGAALRNGDSHRDPAFGIRAKLTDFGIACEMKNTMTRLTGRQTSGTLLYMSPEQLMGDKLDARADIYSFAATLYECLAGRPPFHTGDIPTQIMQKRPADIESIPAHVNNALRRGLSKDKAARQRTCVELLDNITEPQPAPTGALRPGRTQSKPEDEREEEITTIQPEHIADAFLPDLGQKGLLVESDPPGATIILNGVQLDEKTPFNFKDLPSGTYDIVLSLEGYDSAKKSVYYASGEEKRVAVTLIELAFEGFKLVESEGKDATTDLWKEIVHIKSGIALRLVPAGEFDMGSPSGESERDDDEEPVHRVKISKLFYMGKYEITQKQWKAVMGSNPSHFKGDNLPVERVSWNKVKEFCRKAGGGLRLPTEAEWEYACRAGTTTPFNTGANITTDQANYNGNYPYGGGAKGEYRERTTPVGTFKPNAWGLYDMHGNVREWCEDWYGKDYYSKCKNGVTDPRGPRSGECRVLRGGSWSFVARGTRSANRDRGGPGNTNFDIGFRVIVAEG